MKCDDFPQNNCGRVGSSVEIKALYQGEWNGTDLPFLDFTDISQISTVHCLVAWVIFINLGKNQSVDISELF